MKKGMMLFVLAALALSLAAGGCRSEASVDEDGVKVDVQGND